MAMNGTTLGNAIASALSVTDTAAKAAIIAMANAIVTHIQTNAVVSTTDSVPALGLIAPPGTAGGPVTGAASGTGTGTIA